VLDWNPRSRRVLEKASCRLEGRLASGAVKDGVVVDRELYTGLRDDASPPGDRRATTRVYGETSTGEVSA
jgi:RimJ/RimL family protein N-acetyltransferase